MSKGKYAAKNIYNILMIYAKAAKEIFENMFLYDNT